MMMKDGSDVEEKIDRIAVLNDVCFSFATKCAVRFCRGKTSGGDEIVIGNNLGANETALDIAMDRASCFDGADAALDGPGTTLIWSNRKERHQSEQIERNTNDPIET